MRGRGAAALVLFNVLAVSAAAQTQAKAPDFSGTWKLDAAASTNVSPNMKDAVLLVEQRGDRIRITPERQGAGQILVAGEEIIADGQPYEKGVGGGKAVVTARWSADRKFLELETSGTDPEKKLKMLQIARWSLSADGSTWLRETRTTGSGQPRFNRVVFRRQQPETPPTKAPPAKPSKN